MYFMPICLADWAINWELVDSLYKNRDKYRLHRERKRNNSIEIIESVLRAHGANTEDLKWYRELVSNKQ
jgi:hypothetical protein